MATLCLQPTNDQRTSVLSLDAASPGDKQRRIKRKPAPRISLEERFPPPDPDNPFATLEDLRRRYAPDSAPLYGCLHPWNATPPQTAPPKVATFELYADPPTLLSDSDVMSDGETSSPSPRPPPKSPLRYSRYRGRSHSASNVLSLADPDSSGHPSRHFSESLPSGPDTHTRDSSEDRISPAPSLVHDAGHSDSSSDVDGALPSPVAFPTSRKHTPSRKSLQRLIGRKGSSSNLLGLFQSNSPSEPPVPPLPASPLKRRNTDVASHSRSRRPSAAPEAEEEAEGSDDRARILDQTLATLSGLDAGSSTFGPQKVVAPQPKRRKVTWSFFDEIPRSAVAQPRDSYSSSGSSTDHSCSSILTEAVTTPSSYQPTTANRYDETPITSSHLTLAACIPVIDATGERFPFGSLFGTTRIYAVLIRHWSCIASQTYVREIVRRLSTLSAPDLATTRVVVIGNGSQTLIQKYRRTCDIPECVEVYAEPSLRLHRALGVVMTHEKEKEAEKKELDNGSPATKKTPNFAKVVARALKSSTHQGPSNMLGGAFHFGPGLSCSYAHRMSGLHDYAPLDEILPFQPPSPSKPEVVAQAQHLPPSLSVEIPSIQHSICAANPEADSTCESETGDVLCELGTSSQPTEGEVLRLMQERAARLAKMRSRKQARRENGTPSISSSEE